MGFRSEITVRDLRPGDAIELLFGQFAETHRILSLLLATIGSCLAAIPCYRGPGAKYFLKLNFTWLVVFSLGLFSSATCGVTAVVSARAFPGIAAPRKAATHPVKQNPAWIDGWRRPDRSKAACRSRVAETGPKLQATLFMLKLVKIGELNHAGSHPGGAHGPGALAAFLGTEGFFRP